MYMYNIHVHVHVNEYFKLALINYRYCSFNINFVVILDIM